MPDDGLQPSSLAYRKSRDEIWAGKIPAKYTRLLPYIVGSPVIEMGSAEGVLSLLIAKQGAKVTGLELRQERHQEALRLREHWGVKGCTFFVGDIRENLHLLNGMQTFVAVRAIYYLRNDAGAVLAHCASAGVGRVVLCGNRNRAAQSQREPESDLGRFNRAASLEGMHDLLVGAGYGIETFVRDGDPIIVGFLQ